MNDLCSWLCKNIYIYTCEYIYEIRLFAYGKWYRQKFDWLFKLRCFQINRVKILVISSWNRVLQHFVVISYHFLYITALKLFASIHFCIQSMYIILMDSCSLHLNLFTWHYKALWYQITFRYGEHTDPRKSIFGEQRIF